MEFAETYTQAERFRFAIVGVVLGGVAIGASKLWLFPWIASYSTVAGCSRILGASGAKVLWYSVFVGIPLLAALVTAFGFGRLGIRILRERQFPPHGKKVFRATRIKRGPSAVRIGYFHVFAFVPFLALAIWGYSQAVTLSNKQASPTKCAANNSFKPKPLRGSA